MFCLALTSLTLCRYRTKSSCDVYGKTVTVDDFRGVSISRVISKVFEHCIFDRYGPFFETMITNLDSKRMSAVRMPFMLYAWYHSEHLCLDLSKAFDKMNHHDLFIKLMDRNIPVNLLSLLENWFSSGVTCVKVVSRFVGLSCGVRQGGVLSPHFFAIYIDSVVKKVSDS